MSDALQKREEQANLSFVAHRAQHDILQALQHDVARDNRDIRKILRVAGLYQDCRERSAAVRELSAFVVERLRKALSYVLSQARGEPLRARSGQGRSCAGMGMGDLLCQQSEFWAMRYVREVWQLTAEAEVTPRLEKLALQRIQAELQPFLVEVAAWAVEQEAHEAALLEEKKA